MFRTSLRLLGALIAASCAQFALASDFYNVWIELLRDGKVVAQPILIVSEGKEAKLTVNGGENYEVKVVVTALPENHVKLETNFQTEHGGFYPTFVSRDGQPVEAAMNQYRARFVVSKNRA